MSDECFHPMSGKAMPRFGGLATMMRRPKAKDAAGLDASQSAVRDLVGADLVEVAPPYAHFCTTALLVGKLA